MPKRGNLIADLAPSIRHILQGYGKETLFYEILQNSDDSGATKQKFIIDLRSHPNNLKKVLDPVLQNTQGPSLICYNDSTFKDFDWNALRRLNCSSKADDESKVGKFGIGFKTVYHITDNPHVLSGDTLLVFDPHCNFEGDASMVEEKLSALRESYPDQIDAFNSVIEADVADFFPGTIVRVPFRTRMQAEATRIVPLDSENSSVSADDIRQLMKTFQRDLGHSMLFLRNVNSIELEEIGEDGTRRVLAEARKRIDEEESADGWTTTRVSVRFQDSSGDVATPRSWRLLHLYGDQEEAAEEVRRRLNKDFSNSLKMNKLSPGVSLAIPVQDDQDANHPPSLIGRLFTVLPLPIITGFPLHIHGMFALSPDRASLKGSQSNSMQDDSTARYLSVWNEVLFDVFVARAWSELLSLLLTKQETRSIYEVFPGLSQHDVHWSRLPHSVIKLIKEKHKRVWKSDNNEHLELDDVLAVSREETNTEVTNALKNAGANIAHVPQSVFKLLSECEYGRWLSRQTVKEELIRLSKSGTCEFPDCLTADDKKCLLTYLCDAQTFTIEDILDIPLIPTIDDGKHTSFFASRGEEYIGLEKEEPEVFKRFNRNFIALWKLPEPLANVFRDLSQTSPRCCTLYPDDVFDCLDDLEGIHCEQWTDVANSLDESRDDRVKWLCAFYSWLCLSKKTVAKAVLNDKRLTQLCILPILGGEIIRASRTALASIHLEGNLKTAIAATGVALISDELESDAIQERLCSAGILKLPDDLGYVLDNITIERVHNLVVNDLTLLQKYFLAVGRSPYVGSLTQRQRDKLRSVPIFVTLERGEDHKTVRGRGAINNCPVFLKVDIQNVIILRTQHDEALIDMTSHKNRVLANLVEPRCFDLVKTDIELMEQGLQVFESSPDATIKSAFTRCILPRFNELSNQARQRLCSTPFVAVADGTTQCPNKVIDLDGPLVGLFDEHEDAWPIGDFAKNTELYRLLRTHQLLMSHLTTEITINRLQQIHDTTSRDKALALLTLLEAEGHIVVESPEVTNRMRTLRWLPSESSTRLVSVAEARHKTDQYAFDMVLEVINVTNGALINALGWDGPLSFDVVREQMRRTLDDCPTIDELPQIRIDRVTYLIRYVAKHRSAGFYNAVNIHTLREDLRDRPWIPIDNKLFPSRLSITGSGHICRPFRNIGSSFREEVLLRFLRDMGCNERPSKVDLLQEINNGLDGSEVNDLDGMIALLRELVNHGDWKPGQTVKVPDSSQIIRTSEKCYFADSANVAATIVSGQYQYRVHPRMDIETAERLQIPRLSSLYVEGLGVDGDKEQTDTNSVEIIRGTLQDYQVQYAGLEFVAHATGAGAKSFIYMLNEPPSHAPPDQLISKAFFDAHNAPALSLYHDVCFTKQDLRDLRRLMQGGMPSNHDGLEKFGRGLLSLFYFTDLVTVVSGDHVLVFDPTGVHLPPTRRHTRRTSMLASLESIQSKYPRNLVYLNKISQFSVENGGFLDGTIFWLPLRLKNSAGGIWKYYEESVVKELVTKEFFDAATKSFFFTELQSLEAQQPPGHSLWSIKRSNMSLPPEPIPELISACKAFTMSLDINPPRTYAIADSQKWVVLRAHIRKDDVPNEYNELIEHHCLSTQPRIGIAARFDQNSMAIGSNQTHHLFSSLPVSVPEELDIPAHIDGSFALGPGGHSVPFNQFATTPEAAYNFWLVTAPLPQVYMALLQHVGRLMESSTTDMHIQRWWPSITQAILTPTSISSCIADAFYRAVPYTNARICFTPGAGCHSPTDTIFSLSEPKEVKKIFEKLPGCKVFQVTEDAHGHGRDSLNDDAWLRQRFPENMTITPIKVAATLRQHTRDVRKLFDSGELSISDMEATLSYLIRDGVDIDNLPLLVLANKTLLKYRRNQIGESRPAIVMTQRLSSDAQLIQLLGPEKFISNECSPATIALLDQLEGSPIKHAETDTIVALVKTKFPPSDTAFFEPGMSSDASKLLALLPKISIEPPVTLTQLEDIPLVRVRPASCSQDLLNYVSLSFCRHGPVLCEPGETKRWQLSILEKLGLHIVIPNDSIQRHLTANGFEVQPNLLNFLVRLSRLDGDGVPFETLANDQKRKMAEWIMDESTHFSALLSKELLTVLSTFDIWRALPRGGSNKFCAATEVIMLPQHAPLHAFSSHLQPNTFFAEYNWLLAKILEAYDSSQIKTSRDVPAMLHLSSTLPLGNLRSYHDVFDYLIKHGDLSSSSYKLPNGNGKLLPLQELCSSEQEIFRRCLHAEVFIHPSFQDFQPILIDKKLIKSELDADALCECAEALHRSTYPDMLVDSELRSNAQLLFRLCNTNSTFLESVTQASWSRLSRCTFVPRHNQRMRDAPPGFVPSDYTVEDFPALVCPTQLARREYEDVAWTQYALFEEQPSESLTSIPCLSGFGVPTFEKVVQHLEVLVTGVYFGYRDRPGFKALRQSLYNQLQATYEWLNRFMKDCDVGEHIYQRLMEPLFLNINSPHDNWRFLSPSQICFGQTRDAPSGPRFSPRDSLRPFESLLLASGAIKVTSFQAAQDESPPVSSTSDSIRTSFNLMRLKGVLLDTVLKPLRGTAGTVPPNDLRAHSALLAASIPHIQHALALDSEKYKQVDGIYELEFDYSAFTLSMVIDCVYTSCSYMKSVAIQLDADEFKEELDELLEVICAADYMSLPELASAAAFAIRRNELVQLDTCDYIYDKIKNLSVATDLRYKVKRYIDDNSMQLSSIRVALKATAMYGGGQLSRPLNPVDPFGDTRVETVDSSHQRMSLSQRDSETVSIARFPESDASNRNEAVITSPEGVPMLPFDRFNPPQIPIASPTIDDERRLETPGNLGESTGETCSATIDGSQQRANLFQQDSEVITHTAESDDDSSSIAVAISPKYDPLFGEFNESNSVTGVEAVYTQTGPVANVLAILQDPFAEPHSMEDTSSVSHWQDLQSFGTVVGRSGSESLTEDSSASKGLNVAPISMQSGFPSLTVPGQSNGGDTVAITGNNSVPLHRPVDVPVWAGDTSLGSQDLQSLGTVVGRSGSESLTEYSKTSKDVSVAPTSMQSGLPSLPALGQSNGGGTITVDDAPSVPYPKPRPVSKASSGQPSATLYNDFSSNKAVEIPGGLRSPLLKVPDEFGDKIHRQVVTRVEPVIPPDHEHQGETLTAPVVPPRVRKQSRPKSIFDTVREGAAKFFNFSKGKKPRK